MRTFCNDRDLLKYEADIFSRQTFTQFLLCRGTNATLSDGYLSCNNVDFSACGVGAGNVVFVSDELNGWQGLYEVIQCVLAGQIRISVLRGDVEDEPLPAPDGTGLVLHIMTFMPVIYEVSFELAKYYALAPAIDGADYSVDDINDITPLKEAAVFGTLARIYSVMPFGSETAANQRIGDKQKYYLEMYRRSRESCGITLGAERKKAAAGVLNLRRA